MVEFLQLLRCLEDCWRVSTVNMASVLLEYDVLPGAVHRDLHLPVSATTAHAAAVSVVRTAGQDRALAEGKGRAVGKAMLCSHLALLHFVAPGPRVGKALIMFTSSPLRVSL